MIKLLDILENKILVTRRSPEERSKNYLIATQKQIQQYMKDGSQGDLNLDNIPNIQLPKGLTVGGSLYLNSAQITSLPQGITIGGELDLRNANITSLPQDLIVGDDLYLFNAPMAEKYTKEQIRAMVPGIKGKIYI